MHNEATGLQPVVEAMDALAWAWLEYREGEGHGEKVAEVVETVERLIAPAGEAFPDDAGREAIVPLEKSSQDMPGLMDPQQVELRTGIQTGTLGHWYREGLIPIERDGGRVLLTRDTVQRLQGLVQATPPRYKSPAAYVARMLRIEKYGDPRM